jgi:hypothetical protein
LTPELLAQLLRESLAAKKIRQIALTERFDPTVRTDNRPHHVGQLCRWNQPCHPLAAEVRGNTEADNLAGVNAFSPPGEDRRAAEARLYEMAETTVSDHVDPTSSIQPLQDTLGWSAVGIAHGESLTEKMSIRFWFRFEDQARVDYPDALRFVEFEHCQITRQGIAAARCFGDRRSQNDDCRPYVVNIGEREVDREVGALLGSFRRTLERILYNMGAGEDYIAGDEDTSSDVIAVGRPSKSDDR